MFCKVSLKSVKTLVLSALWPGNHTSSHCAVSHGISPLHRAGYQVIQSQHDHLHSASMLSTLGISFLLWMTSELQKDFLRPVSQFSTKKCPKYVFAEFCNNITHKIEKMLTEYRLFATLMLFNTLHQYILRDFLRTWSFDFPLSHASHFVYFRSDWPHLLMCWFKCVLVSLPKVSSLNFTFFLITSFESFSIILSRGTIYP